MKKFILSFMSLIILLSAAIFGFSITASAKQSTVTRQETTISTQTTTERTDDDPFADIDMPDKEKTPTFYYILGGVAGVIIVFAVLGFITSIKKK